MRKHILSVLFIFLATALFSAGRTENAAAAEADKGDSVKNVIEITDSTGNKVALEKIPERITFAGRASIMVADALYMFPEASKRIVGVGFTNQGNGNFTAAIDPAYKEKAYLDQAAGVEQIARTRPDLVILKSYLKKSLGKPVQELGIPVLYMGLENPRQYEDDFRVLGKVFGNPERAEEIIAFYRNLQDRIVKRTEKLEKKPKVLFVYHSSKGGETAFNVPPKNWIQTGMVEMAGGDPVWSDDVSGNGWTRVNLEQIAVWNPDYVFVAAYKQNVKAIVKKLLESKQWENLNAGKNGRIFPFPEDFYSWDQPDSRWILGAAWLARTISPDLFKDFNMEAIAEKFYKELYFMDDSVYKREIKSRLGW